MSNIEQNLFEKDQIRADEFRKRFNYFLDNLSQNVEEVVECKEKFSKSHQNILNQIEDHYENIVHQKILPKKRVTEFELEKEFNQSTEKFKKAIEEATRLRQRIETEITAFENLIKSINTSDKNNNDINRFLSQEEFYEEDALMINDSINEFNQENEGTKSSHNEIQHKLEQVYTNIEMLMNEKLAINNIHDDFSSGLFNENTIKLVKCFPDLSGICFGHLKKDFSNDNESVTDFNSSLITSNDLIDHTQFKMETQLSENFKFKKLEKCQITFSCPDTTKQRNILKPTVHENLQIDLIDSQQNIISFDLKEKLTLTHRFIKMCFLPQTAGIYKLSIKYKNIEIPDSPFYFVVLPEQVNINPSESNTSLTSSNSSFTLIQSFDNSNKIDDTNQDQNVFKRPQSLFTQDALSPSSSERRGSSSSDLTSPNTVDLSMGFSSICAGRGRLLKMKSLSGNNKSTLLSNRSVISNPVNLTTSVSQKRKSPNQLSDAHHSSVNYDDIMDQDDENTVKEISNKLKKVVCVDESVNKYHNYSMQSIMSLNVHTNSDNCYNPNQDRLYRDLNSDGYDVITNHLKKYSNPNSLVRLLDDNAIPPLKAQFQRKFSDCNFPIGVRSCNIRNWLIVCDNGNHSIKIFERSTGELLREIKEDKAQNFTLRRPSAILINQDDKSEIYVKDDKEILVFDLEQDCQLVRKFGSKVLRKPYGLAFDTNKNLIVVDADFKNPIIYTFDRITGNVLNSKPYQPVLKNVANSNNLQQMFGPQKILSNNLVPFEKTKVRFICSNQDSIYASDLGRSIVYKTNLNGEIQLAFGFQGRKRGELNEPSGVHVNSDGNAILVGDSKNDRIQIYDSKGRYKCDIEFLDEKIIRPSDIHVDQEGYLYVSCFIQQCVKKYKLIAE